MSNGEEGVKEEKICPTCKGPLIYLRKTGEYYCNQCMKEKMPFAKEGKNRPISLCY